ncbi:Rossmann fold nucleotide-binding protein [Calidifontibacter sp. DB0510]|uniref:Rossmann fold nucleotide-binding protein n=1 Tax=Metallococcus carri TaxID=1656884 RepID=A0A967AYU0_9MICO|nr:Rossmann fold nucleotide-binding protein [Metallococcus carri]NHN54320.1 Rossmann fold nucleotide-binding protein [Metallococcus carri]NOP36840.1 Rossmann fold nucleotide-binding protein [Calidifontibacter sp. DB2511S]
MPPIEVETADQLRTVLASGRSLHGLRFQDLDLTVCESQLLARGDLRGLVVLGGQCSQRLEVHLRSHGAFVFAEDPSLPIDTYRAHLYTYRDLYAGLPDRGYPTTPDARAYAWFKDPSVAQDAYITLQRAIHDDGISDALREFADGRLIVGIMGGHAVARGTTEYADTARLARDLANRGLGIATGGGPGAMEAANLGALQRDSAQLDLALTELAKVPDFRPSIDAWAKVAWQLRDRWGDAVDEAASLGIPTWFYGHEPPNLFAGMIAKFFSNALREDLLLQVCTGGIIVMPGAAGTVQEIFQAVTPRYYASPDVPLSPLVLVGRRQWTTDVPVWPALQALGQGSPLGPVVHLVDSPAEAIAVIAQAVEAAS